jgi:hypothetical protein
MKTFFWRFLVISPAVLGMSLVMPKPVLSAEATQPQSSQIPLAPATVISQPQIQSKNLLIADVEPLNPAQANIQESSHVVNQPQNLQTELGQTPTSLTKEQTAIPPETQSENLESADLLPANSTAENSLSQITSVSQLADVQPTDWAFQALQSLVERYGCIAGYPDGTFRGNRALTRYEFAAGLNACLDKINELIQSGTANFASKQDLITVQKLQEEFAAELATLRGRIDALDTRVTELKANQFSTTTKLQGEVVMALAGVLNGQGPQSSSPPTGNRRNIDKVPTFGARIRLNLNTSFTGEDRLITRLEATTLKDLSTSTLTPEGSLYYTSSEASNNFQLADLYYMFPLGNKTTVYIAANGVGPDDFLNTLNLYNDGNGGMGSVTNFGTRNSIYNLLDGAGIGFLHSFNSHIDFSAGYLASDAANPQRGSGLFNGPYGAIAQLTIKPTDQLSLGLIYAHAYNNDISTGSTNANLVAATGRNVVTDAYSVAGSWRVNSHLAVNGWGGYTKARVINAGNGTIWYWAVSLAFPDLFKEGNSGGLIVGMEPKLSQLDKSVSNAIDGLNKDRSTSLHLEGFYTFQINSNISVTPALVWLTAPNHDHNNNGMMIGTIRTTFRF